MAAVHRQRPRGQMRRRILRLAADWLQQRGYHGFSFGQLAEALEVQSSAIHYHFPTKADLATALFRQYRDELAGWRAQMADARLEPDERIERFLDLEARDLEGEHVGPLGIAAVEYASLPSAACAEAEALCDDLIDWLTATLVAGRAAGRLDFPGDAGDQACAIMAAAQGALQLARIHGRSDFAAVRRAILAGVMSRGV
ncbi:TetR/AcrR family transcriptional regulator [Spiribacter vilamensis]|uniref:TetR family transcriptional regulator n=1 Tax=Spiribacter vilamensis TaxID=531306 RepID=A0A4Q8D1J1_9GAMM|nr:TetR/AcrR family transcriptional regulator [Spiribacter vilamensis]RZU99174.1 TetR family transcriptional regulator [Spiribacter vilamensis]TVO61836.1 TetR/AcrR family transcriptional regulator [Spiribacter vilamensis]